MKPEIEENVLLINDKSTPCKGLRYVLTGNFNCTSNREDIKKMIIELGGAVTGSVSGKTNVLLHGHILEDGREPHESRKYKQALEKGVLITNEEGFSKEL